MERLASLPSIAAPFAPSLPLAFATPKKYFCFTFKQYNVILNKFQLIDLARSII